MIVRPAHTADAPAICAIWNPLIEDTATTFTTELKTEQGIASDIESRGPAFLVVQEGSAVQGFATYFPFRGGPGYARTKELTINLGPQARGRGMGRALFSALEAAAQSGGIHSLWAGVSGENPAGVSFHKALGFEEIARLPQVGFKFDRWMDLVLLQKRL